MYLSYIMLDLHQRFKKSSQPSTNMIYDALYASRLNFAPT